MTFNRRFADQIAAHRESFTPPPEEQAREGRVAGWQDGGYVVDVGGSRSVRQSATNGSIPVGGVACVRGRVDAQPAIAPQPRRQPGRVDAPAGPVKILFSVLDGAERVYYVGGDRKRPKELFREELSVIFSLLVATGPNRSDFYWQHRREFQSLSSYTRRVTDSRYPSFIDVVDGQQYFGYNSPGSASSFWPSSYLGDGIHTFYQIDGLPIGTVEKQTTYENGTVEVGDPYPGDVGTGIFIYPTNWPPNYSVYPNARASVGMNRSTRFWNRRHVEIGNSIGGWIWDVRLAVQVRGDTTLWASGKQTTSSYAGFNVDYFYEASVDGSDPVRLSNEAATMIDDSRNLLRQSIRKGKLWISPSMTTLTSEFVGQPSKDSIDFQSIDLRTSAISSKQVKIQPLKNTDPTLQIESVSYFPL